MTRGMSAKAEIPQATKLENHAGWNRREKEMSKPDSNRNASWQSGQKTETENLEASSR